jgi:hypothetical protein
MYDGLFSGLEGFSSDSLGKVENLFPDSTDNCISEANLDILTELD